MERRERQAHLQSEAGFFIHSAVSLLIVESFHRWRKQKCQNTYMGVTVAASSPIDFIMNHKLSGSPADDQHEPVVQPTTHEGVQERIPAPGGIREGLQDATESAQCQTNK